MIEIIFKFNQQKYNIEYNEPKPLKEIFEEFAKKHSLDVNNLFLVYNDEKIDLNTQLNLEDQFDLLKNKTKQILEFSVCEETEFEIIFVSYKKNISLKVDLNEKIKDVLKRFSNKARIDLTGIYFRYGEETFDYENIGDKAINALKITNIEKEEKIITISYTYIRDESIISNDSSEYRSKNIKINSFSSESESVFRESLISISEGGFKKRENKDIISGYYLKIFLILFIQYVFIISLSIIGFLYKFNEILIKSEASLVLKYTPFLLFMFALNIIILSLWDYKTKKFMITFLLFFPPFIIYHCLLLSEYIDSKYIIIGLIIVGTEILSLLLNIVFKKYEIKFFILFSSILSFIALLFISVFWIKSLFPILYVSIFWLVSNAIYISLHIIKNKICELDEYYISSLIFNYSIILGLAFLTKYAVLYVYDLIISLTVESNDENKVLIRTYFKIFIILFIQYAITLISTILLFFYRINDKLIESDVSIFAKYIPFFAFMFALAFVIFFCVIKNEKITGNYLIIFFIFYPPFIIYYSLLLSEYMDSKYIIIGLIIVGAEILSLLINILLKGFEIEYFILSSSILSFFALIFISIFWLKSFYPILHISIFWLVSNVIYISIIYTIIKIDKLDDDEYFYSILFFNYGIFLFFAFIFVNAVKPSFEKEIFGNVHIQGRAINIFLAQYILINIFVQIGYSFEWYKIIFYGLYYIISIHSIFFLIASIHFLIIFCKNPTEDNAYLSIYFSLYIPLMILTLYAYRDRDNIFFLHFLFLIFIELFLSFIFIILAKSSNFWIIAAISIISGALCSTPFISFWDEYNFFDYLLLLLFSIFFGIYFSSMLFIINKYYYNKIFTAVMALDFGILAVIFYMFYKFFLYIVKRCKSMTESIERKL